MTTTTLVLGTGVNSTDSVERWLNKFVADDVKQIRAARPVTKWAEYKRQEKLESAAVAVSSNDDKLPAMKPSDVNDPMVIGNAHYRTLVWCTQYAVYRLNLLQ